MNYNKMTREELIAQLKILQTKVYSLEKSEKKHLKLEKKIIKSDEKITTLNKELEASVSQRTKYLRFSEKNFRKAYERANFYKDLFTHDIKNILNGILMSSEMISLKIDNPKEIEKLTKMINKQVMRGSKLVSNVRKLFETELSEIPLKELDALEILKNIIDTLKQFSIDGQVDFKIDSYKENIQVKANDLLADVFENILLNAIKYTDSSEVEIMIRISEIKQAENNYIKFEFIDKGRGIPDDLKKKIFLKGYRKAKKIRGMGLGLALVKNIITAYDGKIWVEDRIKKDYSKGSNFIILIPAVIN